MLFGLRTLHRPLNKYSYQKNKQKQDYGGTTNKGDIQLKDYNMKITVRLLKMF